MDKREAINKVRQYSSLVRKVLQVENIYLFGSYAKDTAREDSDIDVAIVVDKIEGDFFSVNPLLWKLRRQVDHRIEPILIERELDEAGFIGEIESYGIKIS